MAIDIINQDAERQVLSFVENKKGSGWCAIYFRFSKLEIRPTEQEIVVAITPMLKSVNAIATYLLQGGDIIIVWEGGQKDALEEMFRSRLYEYFSLTEKTLHDYYDMQEKHDGFLQLCKQLMEELEKKASAEPSPDQFTFTVPQERVRAFREALCTRHYRNNPDILIVEDQVFSATLLQNLLTPAYKTYMVGDAKSAWKIYLESAPDIAFLDIELPDINGHALAREIRQLDPDAFVVMITGNNYEKDVRLARENGARGFIIKPYSKQKIFDSLQLFKRQKKRA